MRVLIAEDELLERKAMTTFIEKNFNDVHVVGEAVNGREAIKLAATICPDIILMDIKMPGINGLEAIEKINATNSAIKFILISAYDSFDYAKEAMQYGIKDYILKPGKKEEIVTSLRRLQKEIETETKEKEKETALQKERFITKAMQEALPTDFNTLKQTLFPNMKSGYFLVVTSEDAYDTALIKQIIEPPYILKEQSDTVVICIIATHKLEKADMLNMARELQIKLGEAVYIGVGSLAMSPEKLPPSYQEAYAACLQLAGTKKAHVGFMQENDAVQTTINNRLAHFVEKGNDEEAQQLFEQYKDTLTDRDKEDIYMMIKNTLFSKDIPTVERSFNALHTNQDWSDYLKLSCMKVKTFYQSKQHINQAKTYIHDYFNTSITLDDVAFEVDLSPNYFSHLFKQEFGMTFIDYLTHVRLEKAKGLLEENKLTLKEIGYMVGYKDPNYFSRVFKKHYDESPKHFQRAIFKK